MLSRFLTRQRSTLLAAAFASTLTAGMAQAANDQIHFLVPGGAGGGWDSTARGVGEALTKSGLIERASFENLSGGGGGKAIANLIEKADQSHGTLMVNSTPIVISSLSKVFPQSFRDLKPIAAVVGDYGAFVVPTSSKYMTFTEVVSDFNNDPRSVSIAGGSARGSMDHLVAAMAFKAAGGDARRLKYVAYDAGGTAMAGILSGEANILSTGFSEALVLANAGEVRILAITGDERSAAAPNVPTLKELGYDASFLNWRGFFGAPTLSDAEADEYANLLSKMYDTAEWKVVRDRNGWTEVFKPRADFVAFLENQETVIGDLMRELGFLR